MVLIMREGYFLHKILHNMYLANRSPIERLTTKSDIIFLRSTNLVINIFFVRSAVDEIFNVHEVARSTQYLNHDVVRLHKSLFFRFFVVFF